ncbi:Glycerol-3-phosphate regulon repressor [Thalassovita gelatinovora]|uniref:Glycerol-3-phosphate regulon repressor n=1 Tax=Thalassovita gelatinovora TaxID=53501 RepID=A0A0P1FA68_THAGE|nr:DeoR/GlpR family DNA-binding transcription regulator [Thalassovita gelatinovora]QIZ81010.1 DeoR/GlpR transcriptional regulator [Thalassovita gelatinovora]CUH65067.1 Glycerol-3-phosphate regulon repressor [Thalassovita gelatinovora]SEP87031.1 transcriptional regulator, DeoR family [Thalassovita gelatinovora]
MEKSDSARRRDHIVNLLSSYGELSATALSEMLDVTVQTLRADLRALDEARIVRRRHGGATLTSASENISYQPRLAVSRDEKNRIGAAVAALIPNGATVALGTGTTVEAVARALTGHEGLTVATNNIHVVLALRTAERITVLLAGGEVRLRDLDFIGAESLEFFAGLKFDHAIFSVGGVSENGDLLDFNLDEIRARQAITACAGTRTLVVDHAKIGRQAPHSWGRLQELERVVCGGIFPSALKQAARQRNCEIIET